MAAITAGSLIVAYDEGASTWGTAGTVGANDQILTSDFGPLIDPAEMVPNISSGYEWNEYIQRCRRTVTPELTIPLRWSGRLWSFVAQCLGLDTKTGSEDPYTHTMTLLNAIDASDLFGTLAAQLGPSGGELIFEWPAVKPTGFTIEGPDGNGYMALSVRTIADKCLLGGDATNDSSAFDNVTHLQMGSALPVIVPFGLLRFRINTRSGDALDSGDEVKVRRFSWKFDRNMSQEWVSRGSVANQWATDEPIEDTKEDSGLHTLEIEIGDIPSLTWLETYQDQTEQKVEAYWALDADHDIKIEWPCLKLMVPDLRATGKNRIPETLTFSAMKAQSAPTGMPDLTLPVKLTLRDPHDTAYE
jgi:hypothetical protein